MQVRQLDGVADLLDLAAQATDVLVVDVRHLLQDQVGDLGLGDPLEDEAGPRLQRSARHRPAPGRRAAARPMRHDPLLVAVRDDQRPGRRRAAP